MRQDGPRDPGERPISRCRRLEAESEVWQHNSWDDVEWTEERVQEADQIIAQQQQASPHLNNEQAIENLVTLPAAPSWDRFYQQHDRWFFKDRRWLTSEFPELFDSTRCRKIFEVGCGAGNTVFPLEKFLSQQDVEESGHERNPWHITACDFSSHAIELVRNNREYDSKRITVFVHDLTSNDSFPAELVPEGSMDAVVAIFVLSAVDPARLPWVLNKLTKALRPGGLLLIRDYGQYDMTQLRFKPERLIRPNLYIRGDGTGVHYFKAEEMEQLAQQAGLTIVSNSMDRRLLVNRFRKLTMYRVWIQTKLEKPAF